MDKEFDKELALKIYNHLKNKEVIDRKHSLSHVLNYPSPWPEVYKLELLEQFLLIRYAIKCDSELVKFGDEFLDWSKKNMDYLLYDPRLKIVKFITSKWGSFRLNICSKMWWETKYWRLRYGHGWIHIKCSSKWYKPVFKNYKTEEKT